MNKVFCGLAIILTGLILFSFQSFEFNNEDDLSIDSLRKVYAKPTDQWPKPTVDKALYFKSWENFRPLLLI